MPGLIKIPGSVAVQPVEGIDVAGVSAGGGGGGAFSPTSISGLQGWWAADTLGLSDGAAIATWADSSGGSHDAVQATGTKQPLYKTAIQNSLPVVRFDGTDDFLATAAWNKGQLPTVFLAARFRSSGFPPRVISPYNTAGVATIFNNSGAWGYYAAGSAVVSLGGSSATFSVVDYALTTTSTGSAWVNGTLAATFGPDAPDAVGSGAFVIGAQDTGGGTAAPADVGEVLIYNRALNTTERQSVEAYLKTKWGTP